MRWLFSLLALLVAACAAKPPVSAREGLNAVLWTGSAERHFVIEQTYRVALAQLPAARRDGGHVALESGDHETLAPLTARGRPGAVVLDIDETVLDNSAHNARLVADGLPYVTEYWEGWVAREAETALPGALAFTNAADAAGLAVFYISNRRCPAPPAPEAAFEALAQTCPQLYHTMRRMQALGFPRADAREAFLFANAHPDFGPGSDKQLRRALIARTHDIVMLVGDDMGDFLPRDRLPAFRDGALGADEAARVEAFAALFGTRWFMLPNAANGSWLSHLRAGACTETMDQRACAEALYPLLR